VFAIAITLLVLELKVPGASVPLGPALLGLWPSYLAFATSFVTIGIMWVNHHRLFTHIRRIDHGLFVWNLLLLLGVTAVPFPTAVLAGHLGHEGGRVAALLYNGTFVVTAIIFNVLWHHASAGGRLLARGYDDAEVRAITRQYAVGPAVYLACFLVSFLSAGLGVAGNVALAVFFALPPRTATGAVARGRGRGSSEPPPP
jgi:uncharacterized membrane protein